MADQLAYVKHDIKKGIAVVEFFTPAKNSLPGDILNELADTITRVGKNPEAKVIILKSGGDRTFCAGANFQELLSIRTKDQGLRFFSGFAKVINSMRKCPKFILGRVQGKAVGGGVGVVASTDYCFGTRYSSIKLSELNLGIGPFTVGPAVQRKIGVSAFSQMSINANQFYDPEWAKDKGLYTEVFDSVADMDKAAQTLAEELATFNPEAMKEMKKMFWAGTEHWDELLTDRARISGELVLSEFTREKLEKYK